jgi:DUF438 domain-containing protein
VAAHAGQVGCRPRTRRRAHHRRGTIALCARTDFPQDYIKQLIVVLHQAEDLESIDDLHALCSLMQTILMFNDNGIFEYILQDDIFDGVLGMLECRF